MASQRVLLLAVGGALADVIWRDICGYAEERQCNVEDEWSPDDWPAPTRRQVDALVGKLVDSGYTPPILYRSEHVDCWSMGDVFERALLPINPNETCRLATTNNELIGTWVRCSDKIKPRRNSFPETQWLYDRINEAIKSWGELQDRRLLIFVRIVLGGLWTDGEVSEALGNIPDWWTELVGRANVNGQWE